MKTSNRVAAIVGGAALIVGAAGAEAATVTADRVLDDPTPTVNDLFGISVALGGGRALVGESEDDTNGVEAGQAHLFDAGTGALLQTFNDPTPTSADSFGAAVALDGGRALIGAFRDDTDVIFGGQVHLFQLDTGALLETITDPGVDSQLGYGLAADAALHHRPYQTRALFFIIIIMKYYEAYLK